MPQGAGGDDAASAGAQRIVYRRVKRLENGRFAPAHSKEGVPVLTPIVLKSGDDAEARRLKRQRQEQRRAERGLPPKKKRGDGGGASAGGGSGGGVSTGSGTDRIVRSMHGTPRLTPGDHVHEELGKKGSAPALVAPKSWKRSRSGTMPWDRCRPKPTCDRWAPSIARAVGDCGS